MYHDTLIKEEGISRRENPQAILDNYINYLNELGTINFTIERDKVKRLSVISDRMKKTLINELHEYIEGCCA